jgi:hypothetical protein
MGHGRKKYSSDVKEIRPFVSKLVLCPVIDIWFYHGLHADQKSRENGEWG